MPVCPPVGFALLFAQNAAGESSDYAGALRLGLIALAVAGWFYVLLVLPQRKQDKARKEMLGAVKKNDRVLTAAGIYGTVVSVDAEADRVVLKVDDERGVKVAFTRASITAVVSSQDKDKDKPGAKPQLKDQSA